ncbi:hypothetical protein L3Q82_020937 [Scortum barcoo]|uniref:Uncharacterized protein n=1 Tax=Scortum barcoo TaxID=214431 RepID=A0ACB8V9D9_9TELE|nr:hypothetical protein L3Q82_020937 [Scortum barcoo]
MYFLQRLRISLPKTMMVYLYISITESILTSSITTWDAAATDKDRLQRTGVCDYTSELILSKVGTSSSAQSFWWSHDLLLRFLESLFIAKQHHSDEKP